METSGNDKELLTRKRNTNCCTNCTSSAYSVSSLVATKSIQKCLEDRESNKDGDSLSHTLGIEDLISYGIGTTVGGGIYSLIGIGVAVAGPGLVVSFVLGAVACIFTGLSYAEFAARVPITGSAYTYAYTSFGEMVAWIIGWDLSLEYSISAAAIARSWADYFVELFKIFNIQLPTWVNAIRVDNSEEFILSPAAAGIVVFCTIIMLLGVKESATFNYIITALNVSVLIFVITAGSFKVDISNWTAVNGTFFPYGPESVVQGAGKVFFSYIGFDMVSCLAEETVNPERNLPIGIIGSLLTTAVLYVSVCIVITGMVPFPEIAGADAKAPLVKAFSLAGLDIGAKIISFGALFGLTSVVFTSMLAQPRIFFNMARDGLLFPFFKKCSSRKIPIYGTIITGLFTASLAFFMTLEILSDAISIGTLLAFSLVNAGVMVVRYKDDTVVRDQEVNSFALKFLLKIRKHCILVITSYVIFSFLSAMSFNKQWPLWLTIVFTACAVVSFILICFQKSVNVPQTFKCPFLPVTPCLGIWINMYMLAGLNPDSWIRVGVWLAIGMIIYLMYGIRNSKLREDTDSREDTNIIRYGAILNGKD